jgi:hypothetical protein
MTEKNQMQLSERGVSSLRALLDLLVMAASDSDSNLKVAEIDSRFGSLPSTNSWSTESSFTSWASAVAAEYGDACLIRQ